MLLYARPGMRVKVVKGDSDEYGHVGTVKDATPAGEVLVEMDYSGNRIVVNKTDLRRVRSFN